MSGVIGFGPCYNSELFYGWQSNPGISIERAGVSLSDPGWVYSDGDAGFGLIADASEFSMTDTYARPFSHLFGYVRIQTVPESGWKSILDFGWTDTSTITRAARVDLSKSSGVINARLVVNGSVKATGSHSFSEPETFRFCLRYQNVAGSANDVFKLYVNGTEDLSWTADSTHDNGSYTQALLFNLATLETGHASGDGARAWYSSYVGAMATTDVHDETHYPEIRGHLPGAGANTYDDFSSSSGGAGTADDTHVDDLESGADVDDDTTYWEEVNDADPERHSVQIADRTYSNTPMGVLTLYRSKITAAGKSVPQEQGVRVNSTDKLLVLPNHTDANYGLWTTTHATADGGAAWTETKINGSELVRLRRPGSANIKGTALALYGMALGTTDRTPPTPPDRSLVPRRRMPMHVLQEVPYGARV